MQPINPPRPDMLRNTESSGENRDPYPHSHSHVPQAFADYLGIARHNLYHHVPSVIRNAPVQTIQLVVHMGENSHSEHPFRDAVFEVGAETLVETAIASVVGGVPAAVAMGVGHVGESLERVLPPWKHIHCNLESSNPDVRNAAVSDGLARLGANILALPARATEGTVSAIRTLITSQPSHPTFMAALATNFQNDDALDEALRVRASTPTVAAQNAENRVTQPTQPTPPQVQERLVRATTSRRVVTNTSSTREVAAEPPSLTHRTSSVPPSLLPPSSIELRVHHPTLSVTIDRIRATAPGISSTIFYNGTPLACISGQVNLQDLSLSQVSISAPPVGAAGVSLGASTTVRRPWHNLRVTATVPSGAGVSISRRHPLSDVQAYAPVLPGVVGVSLNINLKHPLRGWSGARVVIGLPIPGMNVSFPLRKLIKPIEKVVKKVFGGGGGDGSAGGLPWFPDMLTTDWSGWNGYGRASWKGLWSVDVRNSGQTFTTSHQSLMGLQETIFSSPRWTQGVETLRQAARLEAEIASCQSYAAKRNLYGRIVPFLNALNEILNGLNEEIEAVDRCLSQSHSLQGQIADKAQLLVDALSTFDFGRAPGPFAIYKNHLQLFQNLSTQIEEGIRRAHSRLSEAGIESNYSKVPRLYQFIEEFKRIPDIGGHFTFQSGELHGFETRGLLPIEYQNSALICRSPSTETCPNPGIVKNIHLIPKKRHLLRVVGVAEKGSASLFVAGMDSHLVWENLPTATPLPSEKGAVEIEFRAPDQGTPLSVCSVGVLFTGQATGERRFSLEALSVMPIDTEESEFAGSPIVASVKSRIGGDFPFLHGARHAFLPTEHTRIETRQGQGMRCLGDGDLLNLFGISRIVRLIPNERHIIQLTGSIDPGLKVYLYVENRYLDQNGHVRSLPNLVWHKISPATHVEFTAPDQGKEVSTCRIGVFCNGGAVGAGKGFSIENVSVFPKDFPEAHFHGHPVIPPSSEFFIAQDPIETSLIIHQEPAHSVLVLDPSQAMESPEMRILQAFVQRNRLYAQLYNGMETTFQTFTQNLRADREQSDADIAKQLQKILADQEKEDVWQS